MEYLVTFAPELGVEAAEFAAVWNDNPDSRQVAEAVTAKEKTADYSVLGAEAALIFLAGAAGAFALDVAKDILKDVIKERVVAYIDKKWPKEKEKPKVDIVIYEASGGRLLFIVKKQ